MGTFKQVFMRLVQFGCVMMYIAALMYILYIDQQVIRLGASKFNLWIDWPYFALFGSILTLGICGITFGIETLTNLKSLMLLQLVIYGIHQFEEHSYDYYGRTNAFIHFVNHDVLGLPYNLQCNEYYMTQRHAFIINIIYIWIMIPICILFSTSYPKKSLNIISIGTILINGIAHCIFAIIKQSYNPGLITSIILFIPYCLYMFYILIEKKLITKTEIGIAIFQGILCHIPMQIMLMIVSQEWLTSEEQIIIIYLIALFLINAIFFLLCTFPANKYGKTLSSKKAS